jgi:hypothetical protein
MGFVSSYLESLLIEYDRCAWILKRSIQTLCSGMSVRNDSLRKMNTNVEEAMREEEDLVCALIEHYPLEKLSFGDHLYADVSGALIRGSSPNPSFQKSQIPKRVRKLQPLRKRPKMVFRRSIHRHITIMFCIPPYTQHYEWRIGFHHGMRN